MIAFCRPLAIFRLFSLLLSPYDVKDILHQLESILGEFAGAHGHQLHTTRAHRFGEA